MAKGMSNRDIEDHLRDIYNVEASASLISLIIEKIHMPENHGKVDPLLAANFASEAVEPTTHTGKELIQQRDQIIRLYTVSTTILGNTSGKNNYVLSLYPVSSIMYEYIYVNRSSI